MPRTSFVLLKRNLFAYLLATTVASGCETTTGSWRAESQTPASLPPAPLEEPGLGATAVDWSHYCSALGAAVYWENMQKLGCVLSETSSLIVRFSGGVAETIFRQRYGGDWQQARDELERQIGPGRPFTLNDGSTELRWDDARTGTYYSLGVKEGALFFFMARRPERAPADVAAPTEPVLDAQTEARRDRYNAYMAKNGWTASAGPAFYEQQGARVERVYTTIAKRCYAVIVLSGPGVEDADLLVTDSDGAELGKDVTEDRDAATHFCTPTDKTIRVRPLSSRGNGALFLILYTKAAAPERRELPAWNTPVAGRPQTISRRALSAEALYRVALPSIYVVETDMGQGSAVAISQHDLLTNCHVIQDAGNIAVKHDGNTYEAHVVRADLASDRCYLSTKDANLTPVGAVRPFKNLRVGEAVYAIGAPRGQEGSITDGIISRFDKRRGINVIHTTAAISPGSSGGPLFDSFGNLIGITGYTRPDGQSLNFAYAADEWWN
jgi:hypothetical protein